MFEADGGIRRDVEALSRFVAEANLDQDVAGLVDSIDHEPVGYGHFGVLLGARLHDGRHAVIKVNAQAAERTWLSAVHRIRPGVVPAVFGDGDRLGDLELGWLCMELLPHSPPALGGPEWYEPILEVAASWHDATRNLELSPLDTVDEDWIGFWLDCALDAEPSPALRRLRDRLPDDWAWVRQEFELATCHGDVHFANTGSRGSTPTDPLVLFDPMPGLAPWPYDAARCHTLTNFHRIRHDGPSLVERFADLRRTRGLQTPDPPDIDRASRLFCGWLAVMWRVVLNHVQPDRAAMVGAYVEAALAPR